MNTEYTTHSNMIADTADVRHAPHAYTNLEVRNANADLRDQLMAQRKRNDLEYGVTPWTYRASKWLGKFFTARAVMGTIRGFRDY